MSVHGCVPGTTTIAGAASSPPFERRSTTSTVASVTTRNAAATIAFHHLRRPLALVATTIGSSGSALAGAGVTCSRAAGDGSSGCSNRPSRSAATAASRSPRRRNCSANSDTCARIATLLPVLAQCERDPRLVGRRQHAGTFHLVDQLGEVGERDGRGLRERIGQRLAGGVVQARGPAPTSSRGRALGSRSTATVAARSEPLRVRGRSGGSGSPSS